MGFKEKTYYVTESMHASLAIKVHEVEARNEAHALRSARVGLGTVVETSVEMVQLNGGSLQIDPDYEKKKDLCPRCNAALEDTCLVSTGTFGRRIHDALECSSKQCAYWRVR